MSCKPSTVIPLYHDCKNNLNIPEHMPAHTLQHQHNLTYETLVPAYLTFTATHLTKSTLECYTE